MTINNETLNDIHTDSKIKVVLSTMQLVSIHHREHPTHKVNVTKNKIIKNKVPQVNNPNFIISNIFYF
jgi:hypothetical protein